jgi:hypothetical protein
LPNVVDCLTPAADVLAPFSTLIPANAPGVHSKSGIPADGGAGEVRGAFFTVFKTFLELFGLGIRYYVCLAEKRTT